MNKCVIAHIGGNFQLLCEIRDVPRCLKTVYVIELLKKPPYSQATSALRYILLLLIIAKHFESLIQT